MVALSYLVVVLLSWNFVRSRPAVNEAKEPRNSWLDKMVGDAKLLMADGQSETDVNKNDVSNTKGKQLTSEDEQLKQLMSDSDRQLVTDKEKVVPEEKAKQLVIEKEKAKQVIDEENELEEKAADLSTGNRKEPRAYPPSVKITKLMDIAENLPVYNAHLYCSADSIQRMKYISKSCHAGTCNFNATDQDICRVCIGCEDKQWRSVDGTCNDYGNVFSGVSGSPFERNIPIKDIKYDIPIDKPNIRLVAQRLLRRDKFVGHKTLSLLGMAYYQFLFHDFLQRSLDPKRPVNIKVPDHDSLSGKLDFITVLGTKFHNFGCPFNFSQDHATAWVDGSQLYGSNAKVHTRLRTRQGGKIRLDETDRLEFNENGKPITGHPGGFWVGLYTLHTLFVREHNAICDMLAELNPKWLDQQLFNTARLINSALMFKIFLSDVLPALQPGIEMKCIGQWLWSGTSKEDLLRHGEPDRNNLKSIYPPVWGRPKQDTEVPLSTSEDLGAVNRIHSWVPESMNVYYFFPSTAEQIVKYGSNTLGYAKNTYSALEFSFEFTPNLKRENTDEELLYSLGLARCGAVALNNYPTTYMRNDKVVDDSSSQTMAEIGFDVSLADLLRDRERGTPRYCQYLRLLGKRAPVSFEDLTNQNQVLANKLRSVYDSVEDVDLVIGLTVGAQVRNKGLIPPLTMDLLVAHLHRKIASDRFFTTDFNTETYTSEGMFWLKRNTLKSVICRHYSGMCNVVKNLKNPLVVWNDLEAQAEAASTELI